MRYCLTKRYLTNLFETSGGKGVLSNIRRALGHYCDLDSNPQIANIMAYALLRLPGSMNPRDITLESFMNGEFDIRKEVVTMIKNNVHLDEFLWENLMEIVANHSKPDLAMAVTADIVTFYRFNTHCTFDSGTTRSIILLAKTILCCKEDDKILDLCSGVGDFISQAAMYNPDGRYFGYEINPMNAMLSRLRAEIIDIDAKINVADVFNSRSFPAKRMFSKIFSNYPLGTNLKSLSEKLYEEMAEKIPGLTRGCSRDWAFNYLICKHLEEGGKAVAIMTSWAASNLIDTAAREYFTKAGLIESVISLPDGIVSGTNVSCCMIVFSYNNKAIKMVDASRVLDTKPREYYYGRSSEKEIAGELIDAYNAGEVVTLDEIEKNAFNLLPMHYDGFNLDNAFINAPTLAEVTKDILSGAYITDREIELLATSEDTGIRYANLDAIQDGLISEELTNLREFGDPWQEKNCVMNNDIIISERGYPFKVAVANIKEGDKVLVSNNVHIIRVDKEKIYPYYLAAFLESKAGQQLLAYKTVSSGKLAINEDALKALKIPVIDMNKQISIGNEYKEKLDTIKRLKGELKDALEDRIKVFRMKDTK